jgi:transcription antitermination factor NusG
MQKNWYILFTKAKCEMKVASFLTKKRIENFCPLNSSQIKKFRKNKLAYQPLFTSYVFVKVEEENIFLMEQFDNVISLVYWKGKPALIKDEEIEAIREFIKCHQNIKLQKIEVNMHNETRNNGMSYYSTDGKILMIKNSISKISLPSLGFMMIGKEDDKEQLVIKEITKEMNFESHKFSHS